MSSEVWVQIVFKGYQITDDTRGAELKMLSSNLRVYILSDNLRDYSMFAVGKCFRRLILAKDYFCYIQRRNFKVSKILNLKCMQYA